MNRTTQSAESSSRYTRESNSPLQFCTLLDRTILIGAWDGQRLFLRPLVCSGDFLSPTFYNKVCEQKRPHPVGSRPPHYKQSQQVRLRSTLCYHLQTSFREEIWRSKSVYCRDESEIFQVLGLKWVDPARRNTHELVHSRQLMWCWSYKMVSTHAAAA